MAVLVGESGMNNEENDHKPDPSHESNLYFDRQLQNKLFQVDEDLDSESYESKLSKSWSNLKTGASGGKLGKSDTRIEDITGWFPSAKFLGRRNDTIKAEKETKQTNSFIHPWKDYRMKKEESFVFKHYVEFRKYMEQYRNQHGCHINRLSSGNQVGDNLRRIAFQQSSAPSQQTCVTVQQIHQPGYANSAPPASSNGANQSTIHYTNCGNQSTIHYTNCGNQSTIHYTNCGNQSAIQCTNRKEQLGSLVMPSSNCTCHTKTNATDMSSHPQRPKLKHGQFSRTNTNFDLRHLDSDNSSDCSDVRFRTPSRRTNSASSTRSRTLGAKSPTKITVPANPNARAYPVQALTIQQNGTKPEGPSPSPKPLDNLNCVAPEKQPTVVDRRTVDPNLELALRIHSLNDLLTTSEVPLREYRLPRSMPPLPNHNNNQPWEGSANSDTDSDDRISLDRLSTCALGADVTVCSRLNSQSQHLQKFLKDDPMLSSLNLKPKLRSEIQPGTLERQNMSTATRLFNSNAFLIPKHDVDAMLRVNMWNPVLSAAGPNVVRRELGSQNYQHLISQLPFRFADGHVKQHTPIYNDLNRTSYSEKVDLFNPVKRVRLSITRLDNAVSFCRAQTQNINREHGEKRSPQLYKGVNSAPVCRGISSGEHSPVKMKRPIYDPVADQLTKPTKFEQNLNLPIPPMKILESIPVEKIARNAFTPNKSLEQTTYDVTQQYAASRSSSAHRLVSLRDYQTVNCDALKSEIFENIQPKLDKVAEDKILDTVSSENTSKDLQNGNQKSSTKHEATFKVLQGLETNIGNKTSVKLEQKENEFVKVDTRKVKRPSVASGKCLRSHPKLAGLTWTEKLEVLRTVNKPPDKPRIKQKLKFVKADRKDPMYVWSFEQDQLYERRRIKHLVEQARIKGGKQFEWMYDAQMKSSDTKGEDGAGSGESSEGEEGVVGDKNLGKYGILVPTNAVKDRLFNSHGINKSHSYIAP